MQAPTEPQIELEEVSDWSRVIMQSPWVWGGLLTLGFYTAIPHITVWQAELQRYCCMHWVEYLEVGLFFVGLVVLVQKALALRHEFAAFRTSSLRAILQRPRRRACQWGEAPSTLEGYGYGMPRRCNANMT